MVSFAGYGLRCHRIVALLCRLIGIKDMYAKIEGAINPQNITKAFIRGLLKQVRASVRCTRLPTVSSSLH